MNARIFIYLLMAAIMISILNSALGRDKSTDQSLGATRHINLSGNVFSFAMPENFSKDMPAEPLIEKLDIEGQFNDTLLIERWWDFKKPGWFGSTLGTAMMTISVIKVPQNERKKIHSNPYDVSDRLGLLLVVDEVLNNRYRNENGDFNELYSIPGTAEILGNVISSEFRDEVFNNQKWTSYSCTGPSAQLIVSHVLPINKQAYIEVSFVYSPDKNILPREFREVAYETTRKIEETLHIQYLDDNPIKNIVESEWIDSTTDDAVRKASEVLIPKLFGPEALKIINQSN